MNALSREHNLEAELQQTPTPAKDFNVILATTHRLIVVFGFRSLFTLPNLTSQIRHVNTLFVLRHGPEFFVEPSILEYTERKHIGRSHYPNIPCIYRVCEVLE